MKLKTKGSKRKQIYEGTPASNTERPDSTDEKVPETGVGALSKDTAAEKVPELGKVKPNQRYRRGVAQSILTFEMACYKKLPKVRNVTPK